MQIVDCMQPKRCARLGIRQEIIVNVDVPGCRTTTLEYQIDVQLLTSRVSVGQIEMIGYWTGSI